MNKRKSAATSAALLLALVLMVQAGAACGQSVPASNSEDAAAIETVIETFRQSIIDPSMEAEFLDLFIAEDVTWASVYTGETKDRLIGTGKFQPLLESTYRDFYDFIKEGRYEETFHNVRIDHDESRASVDFDYAFLGNGEILNWGREYWTLLKVAGEWKIASVEWTTHLQEFERCPFEASVLAMASTPMAEAITAADEYLKRMMEKQGIVGLSYAVLRDGELVYADAMGYANREHGVRSTTSTLYPVASISKLVSSTALHVLLEEKGRSVDETVGELLPRRTDLPETWRRLTLRQLLSHSSGAPDIIDYGLFLVPASDRVLLDTLTNKPFAFHPGAQTRYNATGFFLVRLIIEGLSGYDFESYMQQTVFDPIGMKTARYGGYRVPIPDRAKAYRTVDERFELFPLDSTPPMYAAAGLNVSVLDLSAWLEAVLAGDLVSREHLETIWTSVLRTDGSSGPFGLGWVAEQQGDLLINGHGGAGISSVRHYRRTDSSHTISIILLSNGAKTWDTMPDGINRRLAEIFGLGDGFP